MSNLSQRIVLGCPLCGSDQVSELSLDTARITSAFPGSSVVRCCDCQLTFLFQIPSDQGLSHVYEREYFQAYSEAGISLPAESRELPSRYRDRLFRIQRTKGRGRLLEIGVGHGSFVDFARREGWEVRGVDVSQYAVQMAKERLGLDVFYGTVEKADFPDNCFDLVHMSHVLEHLPDPLVSLKEIKRILKPGGLVAIEVPNELENLYMRLLNFMHIPQPPYPIPSTHIYFFNPDTLSRMLTATGYRVSRVMTFRDTEDPRPVRRLLKQTAAMIEPLLNMGPLIEAIAEKPSS